VAAASPAPHDPEQPGVEALIDELIMEILDSADQGQPPKPALAGLPKGGSTLERMLLAEAVAGMLADALAPALAEALAPRIMKALEGGGEEPAGARTPAKAPSRSPARKSDSK
jgi:hypothetical protein